MDETLGYVLSKHVCFLRQIGMVMQARPRRDDETPQGLASLEVVSPVVSPVLSPWRRYLIPVQNKILILIIYRSVAHPTPTLFIGGDLFARGALQSCAARLPPKKTGLFTGRCDSNFRRDTTGPKLTDAGLQLR